MVIMRRSRRRWTLERVLFAMAGTVALVSAALAAVVSPWFLLLMAFAGASQLAFAAFGVCPASWVLSRITRLEPCAPAGVAR